MQRESDISSVSALSLSFCFQTEVDFRGCRKKQSGFSSGLAWDCCSLGLFHTQFELYSIFYLMNATAVFSELTERQWEVQLDQDQTKARINITAPKNPLFLHKIGWSSCCFYPWLRVHPPQGSILTNGWVRYLLPSLFCSFFYFKVWLFHNTHCLRTVYVQLRVLQLRNGRSAVEYHH